MKITRNEIDNLLAGQTANTLIAEVIGLEKCGKEWADGAYWIHMVPSFLPGFSTNIQDAFEAYDALDIFDHPYFELRFVGNVWMCNISGNEKDSAHATTKEMAICRAILLATLEEK